MVGRLLDALWRRARPYPLDDESDALLFAHAPAAAWFTVQALRLWGREVLVPEVHDPRAVEALCDAGARPVFYRLGPRLEPDLDDLARRVADGASAVWLVHHGGVPAAPEETVAVVRAAGLHLVEDCAEAFPSRHCERPLGTFGDAALFDFTRAAGLPGAALVLDGGVDAWVPRPRPPRLRATADQDRFDRSRLFQGLSPLQTLRLRAVDHEARARRRRENYRMWQGLLGGMARPVWGELAPGITPLYYAIWGNEGLCETLRAAGVPAWMPERRQHPSAPARARQVVALPTGERLGGRRIEELAMKARELLLRGAPVEGAWGG